jgi:preprotein translocase subunit SecD
MRVWGILLAAIALGAPGLVQAAPAAGSYLVVDIDAWGQRSAEIDRDRDDLMRSLGDAGIAYTDARSSGPVTTFRLDDPARYAAAVRALKSFTVNDVAAEVSRDAEGRVKVVVPTAWTMAGGGADLDAAVDEVIERAQARGFDEPDVVDLGARRVRLDFKGVADADLMRTLREPQPRLTIQLVDDRVPVADAQDGRLPSDCELAPSDLAGEPYLVVKKQVLLSGDDVADAQADVDQQDQPSVLVRFDRKGADLFAQVTRKHLGQRFVVRLNGRIIFAPVITTVVSDGVGQISGGFTPDGAEGLAKAIRSAAPLTPLVVEDGPLPYREPRVGPQ